MTPRKTPVAKMPHTQSRSSGPTPLMTPYSGKSSHSSTSDDENPTLRALEATNDQLQYRIAKLQANAGLLQREIWLLQRHVKEFNHPLYETWEANILTRLIEVAHANQRRKLPGGIAMGQGNTTDRANQTLAYSNAAKMISLPTVWRLGLSEIYHEALMRYPELVVFRSPNPFQTEVAFAKWLVEEKENRPEKYDFWSALYPVCYGRTVEESSTMW